MRVATTQHYYDGIERVRYVGTGAVIVLATVVFGTLGIVLSLVGPHGRLTHSCARGWSRVFLWISGIQVRVRGGEELDRERRYVFVANHQSALDIPAMLVALPFDFRMMAKASLFRIPFLGWYMRRVGYVPVGGVSRGAGTVSRAARTTRQGTSMLIFPEGTRTPEGEVQRFRLGGALLARDTGLDLVPVAIVGSGFLQPRGWVFPEPGIIEVRVGSALHVDRTMRPAELAETARAAVVDLTRRHED